MKSQASAKKLNAFEKGMIWIGISSFLLLCLVQIALLNAETRSVIADDEQLQGSLLGMEAWFFEPCKMELRLINQESCPDLLVLVNGISVAAFDEKTILLKLKDSDIVELDASGILEKAVIQISAVSSNLRNQLGNVYTITDGIHLVARIGLQ